MLLVPRIITVQLMLPGHPPHELRDVLVSVMTYLNGGPYYGDTVGLTDFRGFAQMKGSTLMNDFEKESRAFPMDYRVPVAECDAFLEIIVRGGQEFVRHRATVGQSSMVSQDVRTLYRKARNELFTSAAQRVPMNGTHEEARAEIRLQYEAS